MMINKFTKAKYRSLALACVLALSTGAVGMAAPATGVMPTPPAHEANGLPPGPPPEGMPGMPEGQMKKASELSAACLVDGESQSLEGQDFASGGTDESAVLVRGGGSLSLSGTALSKTGDSSSADASNFNGQNSVFLCADNSAAHLSNVTLESDADGANAVFSTGEKSVVTAEHIKIHTKNNSSRGLDATYGGTIKASDVDITTEGAHCGALATDRGEGNVLVEGVSLTTHGEGSPCIYSTGNIQLTNGKGEATGSEIAVVEGKNSITLKNADLTGHVKHGVMLYQSFSGDAGVGVAKFTAVDSKLTNMSAGPMFYITNTTATASLKNTQLVQAGGSKTLVQVTSDRWGTTDKNGGDFTLDAEDQLLEGDVLANRISQVTLNLGEGAVLKGAVNPDNQAEKMTVNLAQGAKWELTGDAYVTSLTDEDINFSNIESHGHNIYYDKSENSPGGKTIKLPGGGKLMAH
ncbi:hypothetical protein [Selenomonas sp. AB3002]|uniref:hypothetical protein n=1 Tax=Selenomonas sp. AB3002 TaxID=1392502 RepID=UPI0016397ED0